MKKNWSEENKKMQIFLNKEETFKKGISTLLTLRNELFDEILNFKKDLTKADFSTIPYINSKGYHSKTIAYSIYHIFRIEDIVTNSLIKKEDQIFFKSNFKDRLNSLIITTGN